MILAQNALAKAYLISQQYGSKAMIFTDELIEHFNQNPLYQATGIRLKSAGSGHAVSELHPEASVCWPLSNQPHGGILFTLMDTSMAWAALSTTEQAANCATVSLEIQYPLPAKGPIFTCDVRVVHSTGRSCFVRGEILNTKDQAVAMGQGTFRIIQGEVL